MDTGKLKDNLITVNGRLVQYPGAILCTGLFCGKRNKNYAPVVQGPVHPDFTWTDLWGGRGGGGGGGKGATPFHFVLQKL